MCPKHKRLALCFAKKSKEIITVSQAVLGKSQEEPLFLKRKARRGIKFVWAQLAVLNCAQDYSESLCTAIWELQARRLPLWRLPQSELADSVE